MGSNTDDGAACQAALLKNLVLEKLLRGHEESPEHMSYLLSASGLCFQSPWFVVLVIRVLEIGDRFESSDPSAVRYEDFIQVGELVSDAFRMAFGELGESYCVNMADGIPCLLNLKPEVVETQPLNHSALEQRVVKLAGNAAKRMRQSYGVTMSVSVSALCHGALNTRFCFREAYDLSIYALTAEIATGPVFFCRDFDSYNAFLSRRTSKLENSFYASFGAWNFEQSAQYMKSMLSHYLNQNIDGHRAFPFFITSHLQSAMSSASPPILPKLQRDVMLHVNGLLYEYADSVADGWGTMKEIASCVDGIFAQVAQLLHRSDRYPLDRIESCAEYIRNNLRDPSLNVNRLCEMCGCQAATFSKAFRRIVGVNPLEYMHLCRINAAKLLLQQENRSLNAVAEDCGYLSDKALIQAFKRYEGITPGKYREGFRRGAGGRPASG